MDTTTPDHLEGLHGLLIIDGDPNDIDKDYEGFVSVKYGSPSMIVFGSRSFTDEELNELYLRVTSGS